MSHSRWRRPIGGFSGHNCPATASLSRRAALTHRSIQSALLRLPQHRDDELHISSLGSRALGCANPRISRSVLTNPPRAICRPRSSILQPSIYTLHKPAERCDWLRVSVSGFGARILLHHLTFEAAGRVSILAWTPSLCRVNRWSSQGSRA